MEHSHNQNRLLAYGSLQVVLTHMDPNLRIHLSICCPSLKSAEKSVPLRCRTVELKPHGFTRINGVSYEVFKYDSGKAIPDLVNELNSKRGSHCDMDENGWRDWSATKFILFRDCVIHKLGDRENEDEESVRFKPYLDCVWSKIREPFYKYKGEDYKKAINYLNHLIFGSRSCPIQVKMLKVKGRVLGLPEGVQFQIRELDDFSEHIDFSRKFEQLKTLLKPTKYPLDHVVVHYLDKRPGSVLHPVLKTAPSVHFNKTRRNRFHNFYQFLISLTNKKITSDRRIRDSGYSALIEKWRNDDRDIGTSVTFQGLRTRKVESIFKSIMEKYQYQENDDGHVFISLNDSSDVRISAGDDLSESTREKRERRFRGKGKDSNSQAQRNLATGPIWRDDMPAFVREQMMEMAKDPKIIMPGYSNVSGFEALTVVSWKSTDVANIWRPSWDKHNLQGTRNSRRTEI